MEIDVKTWGGLKWNDANFLHANMTSPLHFTWTLITFFKNKIEWGKQDMNNLVGDPKREEELFLQI
jgi:hypothetical protein